MNNNDENEEEFASSSTAVGSEPIADEQHQQAGDTMSSSKYDFDDGMLLDLCNDQFIYYFYLFRDLGFIFMNHLLENFISMILTNL